MTAEFFTLSLVSNPTDAGALPVPKGYYRSKLFVAPYSTNILIAAAGPLLSLMERLCLSTSLPPVEQIRENIEHELFAFHSKLQAAQYQETLIGIAYYLMSATIDEILGKSYMRVCNLPVEFKAFTPLTADQALPQERFFEIVEYIKEKPNQYLDLIDLVYYLLIAGFEGRYHMQADGRQSLDNYLDELYQITQEHRFNKPHRLFNENPLPKVVEKSYKTPLVTLGIAVTVLTLAFFTSHFLLENKAKNVLSEHTQLALLDN